MHVQKAQTCPLACHHFKAVEPPLTPTCHRSASTRADRREVEHTTPSHAPHCAQIRPSEDHNLHARISGLYASSCSRAVRKLAWIAQEQSSKKFQIYAQVLNFLISPPPAAPGTTTENMSLDFWHLVYRPGYRIYTNPHRDGRLGPLRSLSARPLVLRAIPSSSSRPPPIPLLRRPRSDLWVGTGVGGAGFRSEPAF